MTALALQPIRSAVAVCAAALVLVAPASAVAQRPATPREVSAINRVLAASERTLDVRLEWVHVSIRGPFALAYLRGPEQTSAILLHRLGSRWRSLADISDEGLRCRLAPASVIADLQLERYNDGPKPCSPF